MPFAGGGYVGVDVFFVISGFLITQLLSESSTGRGSVSLRGFYARRIKRLMPQALLAIPSVDRAGVGSCSRRCSADAVAADVDGRRRYRP